MACVNGSKLTRETREAVLSAYGYRWTVENQARARQWLSGQVPTIPPVSDSQWLAEHAFHVRKDGSLDARRRHCEPACLADDWQPEPAAEGSQSTWLQEANRLARLADEKAQERASQAG
jgi:hypothetical protein